MLAQATWLRSRFMTFDVAQVSFERLDHFGRCATCCVQIRLHFVFEFGFMDGSSFEPCFNDLVAFATWLRPDSFTWFRISFMNVSSFEPYSDHFARISCVVAFQIRNV